MRTLTRTLLILPLLAATVAFGADKTARKEGNLGTGKGSGPYLTKEELRSCMTQRDKMKGDDAELKTEEAAIGSQKETIARGGDALKAQLEAVDRTNQEAVDGYNNAVQARDKAIDAYQARVDAFNTRAEANQTAHSTYGQNCSNRRFFEEDEAAIKKGK